MLKLRIAGCLALFVGGLTMISGLTHEVRVATIVYRTLLSVGLFLVLGYVCGYLIEKYWHMAQTKQAMQDTETTAVPPEQPEAAGGQTEFTPFSPENLAQFIKDKIN